MKQIAASLFILLLSAHAQNSQNSAAFHKLMDADRNGKAECFGDPPNCKLPTIEVCRIDLSAWKQADLDLVDRAMHCAKPGCAAKIRGPLEFLSTEELYRRKGEASSCSSLFVKVTREAHDNTALISANKARLDLEVQTSELLNEILSRATSVIDNHALWEEFLLQAHE